MERAVHASSTEHFLGLEGRLRALPPEVRGISLQAFLSQDQPGSAAVVKSDGIAVDSDFTVSHFNKGVHFTHELTPGLIHEKQDPWAALSASLCSTCPKQACAVCHGCNKPWCGDHVARSSTGWRAHRIFCSNCAASESEEASDGFNECHLTSPSLRLGASSVFAIFQEEPDEHGQSVRTEWPLVCPEAASSVKVHVPLPVVAWSKPEPLRKGGPVVPVAKKKSRGSKDVALEIAGNKVLSSAALNDFESLVYAAGVRESKDSKFALWGQLCKLRGFAPLPLIRESIMQISAILRAAGYSSALQYLAEAKQMHLRYKQDWTEDLQLAFKDAERAIVRASGPPSKAEEVRVLIMAKCAMLYGKVGDSSLEHPAWPCLDARTWIGASLSCLREVELACLTFSSKVVNLDRESKSVSLFLPVSKSDPSGRGVRRSFGCRCSRPEVGNDGPGVCCYCCFEAMVSLQESRLGLAQSDPAAERYPLVGTVGNSQKFVTKNSMVEALQHFAEFAKFHVPEAHGLDVSKVSGHSLRRAGIKYYARKGLKFQTIQWLARHSSDATKGYIEEAMEECPDAARKLDEADSFADQVIALRSKVDSMDALASGLSDKLAKLEIENKDSALAMGVVRDNFRDLVAEVEGMAKPKAVLNLVTCKLHSTRPGSFVGPPASWETKCGWQWILAGRMAQTVNSTAECKVKFSVCKTCSGYLDTLEGLDV